MTNWRCPKSIAAALENTSVDTVRRWVRKQLVKARRTPGGRILILADADGFPVEGPRARRRAA